LCREVGRRFFPQPPVASDLSPSIRTCAGLLSPWKHNVLPNANWWLNLAESGGSIYLIAIAREVLQRYRLRWPLENGLKDLIHGYFIDHILGKDPEKIETNFYCVQVARLAYENFLVSLDEKLVRDSAGYKKTLSTFRCLLFGSHNCQIRVRGNDLELTFMDTGRGELQAAIENLLARRAERGLNRVAWWGGRGLRVKFVDQYADALCPKCPENASEDLS
jgi:hypothetical protein